MGSKRTQVIAEPVFKSIDDVSAALGELCLIEGRISVREAAATEEIAAIRARCEDECKDDQSRKARLVHDIEEYCDARRDEIFAGGKKSLELANGEVNYRLHPPAVQVSKKGKWTIASVIDSIKRLFPREVAESYLRVKEELNKDVLITVEEEVLARVGLEVVQRETFGYKLKLENASAAGAGVGAM